MTFEKRHETVASLLGGARIPYMVTGSFASSMLGMPRTTRDLDVVVDPSEKQLPDLIAAFDPGVWCIDPAVVLEAFGRRSMFNLIHLDSGWKVDVMIRKDRPWSREEFARRAPIVVRGVPVMFRRAGPLRARHAASVPLFVRDACGPCMSLARQGIAPSGVWNMHRHGLAIDVEAR